MYKLSIVVLVTLIAFTNAEEFTHCCEIPDLLGPGIIEKCRGNETTGNHKEDFKAAVCHSNCIAREMGLVDADNFSTSNFYDLVDKLDSKERSLYIAMVKDCETHVEERAKQHKDHQSDSECSLKVFGMMMCMAKKITLDCPDEKKIQNDACNAQRQNFEKFDGKYEKHHGGHH